MQMYKCHDFFLAFRDLVPWGTLVHIISFFGWSDKVPLSQDIFS